MKILCTICARGGSQGVKNKNIIPVCRKPLIAHSITQAKKTELFDVIAVSSDSKKIHQVAKQWGADHLVDRPLEMATSTAPKLPAIQNAVLQTENFYSQQFDIIVDLDATSPLRSVDDIKAALQLFMSHGDALNLVTAFPSRRSPYFNMLEVNQAGYVSLAKNLSQPVYRRQDAPASYDMNASIYIWKRDTLFSAEKIITDRTLLYVMPEERSIDIDSKLDLTIVRALAKHREDLN